MGSSKMIGGKQTLLMLLLFLILPVLNTSLLPSDPPKLVEGHCKYQELSLATQLPKYGPCWVSALSQLETTCDQLTDFTQARMALMFANCFLAQSGQSTYPCDKDQEIHTCLKDVDAKAFTAYTDFFTHTQNMCHFLKSQEWREMTDNLITRLSS